MMKREKIIRTKINWKIINGKHETVKDLTDRQYRKMEEDKRFKVKKI
jgi:truncated hemoglobin YjbI